VKNQDAKHLQIPTLHSHRGLKQKTGIVGLRKSSKIHEAETLNS
jgi:hypothetical protein